MYFALMIEGVKVSSFWGIVIIFMSYFIHVCGVYGILQVWMLTGDKLETAASIALSSRLVSRAQTLFTFKQVRAMSPLYTESSIISSLMKIPIYTATHNAV